MQKLNKAVFPKFPESETMIINHTTPHCSHVYPVFPRGFLTGALISIVGAQEEMKGKRNIFKDDYKMMNNKFIMNYNDLPTARLFIHNIMV